MNLSDSSDETIKALYDQLEAERKPFLDRAREAAKLTIPYLVPEEGHNIHANFPIPYQSLGAFGVRNLASKLLLALFPPNEPFVRYRPDERTTAEVAQVAAEGGADPDAVLAEIEMALSDRERSIVAESEALGARPIFAVAFMHMLVAGNGLIKVPLDPKENMRFFGLQQFVQRRDPEGNLLDIVIKERLSRSMLAEDILEQIGEVAVDDEQDRERNVSLYTRVSRVSKGWETTQEINSVTLEGYGGKTKIPEYIPISFTEVLGEDYSRGFIEELMGDLRQYDKLSQATEEASMAMAKVIFALAKGSGLRPDQLAKVPNLGFVKADKDDITAVQIQKGADLATVDRQLMRLEARLDRAFLLKSSVQRQGERVTAYELQLLASELDDSLGGVYSVLGRSLQLPFAEILEARLVRAKRIPKLDKSVEPQVITGLEALGRNHELLKWRNAFGILNELGLTEMALTEIKPAVLIKRIGVAAGLDLNDVIKSEEEKEAEAQQEQAQALAQQVAPNLVTQGGQLMGKAMEGAQA